MNNQSIQLTSDGLQAIKDELKDLKDNKLPNVIKRVSDARDFGDLSENAEYHAAREDHAWILGRIEEIEDIITRAQVVTSTNGNSEVALGNQVLLVSQDGQEHEYHIVGEWEADPLAKKISHTSPLGQALVGKKVGEQTEFEAPAGKIVYTVKSIK